MSKSAVVPIVTCDIDTDFNASSIDKKVIVSNLHFRNNIKTLFVFFHSTNENSFILRYSTIYTCFTIYQATKNRALFN